MRKFLTTLFIIASGHVASAQAPAEWNEGALLVPDSSSDDYILRWSGRDGRTYFVEKSFDLSTWVYVPQFIDQGRGVELEWGFSSDDERLFLRLRYSDIPTDDPFYADFDGDGVANYAELWQGTDPLQWFDLDGDAMPDDWEHYNFSGTGGDADPNGDDDTDGVLNAQEFAAGIDPNSPDSDSDGLTDGQEVALGLSPRFSDTDGDGLDDGWEHANLLNPLVADADTDAEPDGLSNADEYRYGTDPQNPDSDGDGFLDGVDGWPNHPELHPPRLPETRYVVIELGEFWPIALNNHCEVVGNDYNLSRGVFWKANTFSQLAAGTEVAGLDDDGHIAGTGGISWNTSIPPVPGPLDPNVLLPGSSQHAFYWSQFNASPTDLGDLSLLQSPTSPNVINKANSGVAAVSPGGAIVGRSDFNVFPFDDGWTWVVGSSVYHAFLSYSGSAIQNYGTAGDNPFVTDVNDSGSVVGSVQADAHGKLWRVNGTVTDFGLWAQPSGINSSNDVVGSYTHFNGVPEVLKGQPILWTSGATIDLLPGNYANGDGIAEKISDRIQIVGTVRAFHGNSWETRQAMLWQNGLMFDVNSLVPADSPLLFQEAVDVNEQGCILALAQPKADPFAPKKAALLLPAEFRAQDGKINEGFDPPMKGLPDAVSPIADDPADEPVWTSMVLGGENDTVKIVTAPSTGLPLELHVPDENAYFHVTPEDEALSLAETPIHLEGHTNFENLIDESSVVLRTRTAPPQTLATLKVQMLPERLVSVGIYRVIDSLSPQTYPLDGPTDTEILNMLNDRFRHTGVAFRLDGSGNYNVAYDTNSNGKVDSTEAGGIVDALALASLPGKFYIILAKNSGLPYDTDPTKFSRGVTVNDIGDTPFSFLFVKTITDTGGSVSLITAHEMGHGLDLTSRNSDDGHHDPGPFPREYGADGLMKSGGPNPLTGYLPPNPGLWLPHEDWKTANLKAVDYE